MPPEPLDKKLYNKIKKRADKKFDEPTSIYKSSWIVREYKKAGGKYNGKKNDKTGLTRWFKELWIDLNRPTKFGFEQCGRKDNKGKYPLCRPSKRVTKETPKTLGELSKTQISKAKKAKSKVKGSGKIKF